MTILAPSVLGADFTKLGEQVEAIDRAGAQYIHLDVMDGEFVPSISFGMPVIKALRTLTNRVFDVHMMVMNPDRYIDAMKDAGADILCVHQEACLHLDRTLHRIHEAGMQAAVALNPATPMEALSCILQEADMVLIMSVNPGFGGQKFIPYALDKIRAVRKMIADRGLSTRVEVDGGVNLGNVGDVIRAGADTIVAGSAVFRGDPADNVTAFLEKFREAQG
jgi:ribulose-phosphate 3-epimerase